MIIIKSQDGGLFKCVSVRQDFKYRNFILGGTTGELEHQLGKYKSEKEAKFVMGKIAEHLRTGYDGQSEKRTYLSIFEMPQQICLADESEVS